MWKVAVNWKASHRIEKLDCPSMSPDLAPIENVWQLLKMKLREKKIFRNRQSLVCTIKAVMEIFVSGLGYYTCT